MDSLTQPRNVRSKRSPRSARVGHESTSAVTPRWLTIVTVCALILAWQAASLIAGRSALTHQRLVPDVVDLIRAFRDLAFYWPGGLGVAAVAHGARPTLQAAALTLLYSSIATALRLLAGLVLGAASAVAAAVIVGWSTACRRMFLLPAHIVRMFPLLALAPVFSLWFGSSERGVILFVAFATFAILFVVVLSSLAKVPREYFDFARSLGASRVRAYATVVLPAALPALRGGALLALGFGWSMVIAAEFLGQTVGLGSVIDRAQQFGHTSTIAVVAVFVILYGAASYWLASRIFDYLVRWAE